MGLGPWQFPLELHCGASNSLWVLLVWVLPSTNPSPQLQRRLLLFQAQPCVSVYFLCVPAEPLHADTLCLHISCKFEFHLVGWSPGGLLAAFEIVAGLKGLCCMGLCDLGEALGLCVGRRSGGKRKEKERKGVEIIQEKTQSERDQQTQPPWGCPQHSAPQTLSHGGDTGCCPAHSGTASAQVTADTAGPRLSTSFTEGCTRSSASPARQWHSLPRGSRVGAGSGHPSEAVTSLSHPPAESDGSFHRAQQLPSPSPHSPPTPAGPPCPRSLWRARLKHPAGGWERLAALPRRFSFIKHTAGRGFSHAVGMAESLFLAASRRKMEGGQETGWPVPPPAA